MAIHTVFFDAGHTLLHAQPSVPEIYAAEARAMGANVTAPEIDALWPGIWREFTREYAAAHSGVASEAQDREMWHAILARLVVALPALKAVDFETWFDRLYTMFGRGDVWRLYDDALHTLQSLRRAGVRVGVVSNWDRRLRRIAADLGLDDHVEHYVISAEVGSRKPDTRIFERAMELMDATPATTLHVGDLYDEDVVGARRAGIAPVLIDRKGHGAPGHATGEFAVVGSLREVLGVVT